MHKPNLSRNGNRCTSVMLEMMLSTVLMARQSLHSVLYGFTIWDQKSGLQKANVTINGNPFSDYCMSDSLVVLSGESSSYGAVEVWNYRTARHLYSFPFYGMGTVAFDKSSKYIALSTMGKIEIREVKNGALVQTMYHDKYLKTEFLSFNTDASMLISSTNKLSEGITNSGSASLWKVKDGSLIQMAEMTSDTTDFPLVFSEKGNVMALYNKDKSSIIFRDPSTNEQTGVISSVGTIVTIGIPEKNNCITEEQDGSIILWNILDGKSIVKFIGLEGKSYCTRFNADTSLLIATDRSNVCIWDIKTAKLIKKVETGKFVQTCALFSGADMLISCFGETFELDWNKDTTKNVFLPIHYSLKDAVCNEDKGEITILSERIVETRKLSSGELISTLTVDVNNNLQESFISLNKSGECAFKMKQENDSAYYYSLIDIKRGINKWGMASTKQYKALCISNNNKIAVSNEKNIITIYDTSGAILQTMDNNPFYTPDMFFDEEGNNLYVNCLEMIRIWDVKNRYCTYAERKCGSLLSKIL